MSGKHGTSGKHGAARRQRAQQDEDLRLVVHSAAHGLGQMVLRTDIAGASGAGIDSLLIAGGIHAEEFGTAGGRTPDLGRVQAAMRESSYDPVGVAWSLCW